MTRREFLSSAALPAVVPASSSVPLNIAIRHVLDRRARWRPEQIRGFWSHIWAEAARDFGYCGIRLESRLIQGEVRRSPSNRPIFIGLESGVINLVITDRIPIEWDNGRGLSGVTTRYEGKHVCMVALSYAHGHQIPLLSVNTCVHELLHVLLQDVYENRPRGFRGEAREFRIDLYATRLWLFRDGAAIREAAQAYLQRLRTSALSRS